MIRFALVVFTSILAGCTLAGCTTFAVEYPDGTIVRQSGAPLVSRNDGFTVTHQWLDEDNVLHEVRVERYTEESVEAQERMLRAAFEMGLSAGGVP